MTEQPESKDNSYQVRPIGYVENDFDQPTSSKTLRSMVSHIRISPEYADGLHGIEESRQLNVLFLLHESTGYTLKGPRRGGNVKGVFASRSPHRPNRIGLSRVELLDRTGPVLLVKNLDAINDTPVIDIKPYVPEM